MKRIPLFSPASLGCCGVAVAAGLAAGWFIHRARAIPPAGDSGEATTEGTQPAADEDQVRKCLSVDLIVGLAIYDGQEVVVGIDESRAVAIAYLADDCVRVASAPLP